jgi:hypothetical protein
MIPQTAITFSYIGELYFSNRIKYSKKPVCPFVFYNAHLSLLNIWNQVDSLLIKNSLKFQSPNKSLVSINSSIYQVSIKGYNYALDENLLNYLVFEYTRSIEIQGSVGLIQVDVFKPFIFLNSITLGVNLMNFFHQIGIEWTIFLPDNTQVIFSDKYSPIQEEIRYKFDPVINTIINYAYPDEDFCLFADWPHNKHILPLFDLSHKHNSLANSKPSIYQRGNSGH